MAVTVDPADRRSRLARLTSRGRREVHALDARSDRFAQELLAPLAGAQRAGSSRRWGRSTDCCARQRSSSSRSIPGARRAALPAGVASNSTAVPEGYQASDLVPVDDIRADGVCLVAREADRAVACSVLRHLDGDTDEIKHLSVDPDARGLGLSRVLLAELEAAAESGGRSTSGWTPTASRPRRSGCTAAPATPRFPGTGPTDMPGSGSEAHNGLNGLIRGRLEPLRTMWPGARAVRAAWSGDHSDTVAARLGKPRSHSIDDRRHRIGCAEK